MPNETVTIPRSFPTMRCWRFLGSFHFFHRDSPSRCFERCRGLVGQGRIPPRPALRAWLGSGDTRIAFSFLGADALDAMVRRWN